MTNMITVGAVIRKVAAATAPHGHSRRAAANGLQRQGQSLHGLTGNVDQGREIIIPVVHEGKNRQGGGSGLQSRHNHLQEYLQLPCAVDSGRLKQLVGVLLHKLLDQEDIVRHRDVGQYQSPVCIDQTHSADRQVVGDDNCLSGNHHG